MGFDELHRSVWILGGLALLAAAPACKTAGSSGPHPSAPDGKTLRSITVTSRSLPSDLQIPVDFTCDGKDVAPQLTWSSPPEGTKSIKLEATCPKAGTTRREIALP